MKLEVLPSEYHSKLTLDRSNIFAEDSYLSKSSVFELWQSSLYQWRFHPREFKSTDAMAWGSLVDCLITTPEDFDAQFVVSPFDSYRTKEAREWKTEQEAKEMTIVTEELIAKAEKAVRVLTKTHKAAAEIIAKSQKQVMLVGKLKHPLSDDKFVNLKALLDLAPMGGDYLCDIKTTHDFTPSGFEKTIAKFGYHIQASHYLNLWNQLNPDDKRYRFKIIWQQAAAPYEVAVTELPESDIADGSDMFNYLLGKIVSAAKKNYWPMRFPKPILLGRAAFSTYQEEQEIEGYIDAPSSKHEEVAS